MVSRLGGHLISRTVSLQHVIVPQYIIHSVLPPAAQILSKHLSPVWCRSYKPCQVAVEKATADNVEPENNGLDFTTNSVFQHKIIAFNSLVKEIVPENGVSHCQFNHSVKLNSHFIDKVGQEQKRFSMPSSHIFMIKKLDIMAQQYSDGGSTNDSKNRQGRPDMDKLMRVKDYLIEQIPQVMNRRHEYRMYTPDVIFENNWDITKPYTVVGLTPYAVQLLKARFYFHWKYARVKVKVLGASVDEITGSVTIRWRIAGLPQMKAFMFWKYRPFKIKQKAVEESEWLDGLSTFFINSNGAIYKHRLDRMTPDEGDLLIKAKKPVMTLGT